MIGIGVSTLDEERHKLFLENLDANTSNYKFAVVRVKGVRKAKNQLLHELRDCDHIFLFDDDCYPIKPGWVDFCVNALEAQGHFQYNTERIHGEITKLEVGGQEFLATYNGGGVFLALTKEVLNKVGYMKPEYEGYGWEHLGYSQRIYRSGITLNPYICPVGLDEYLHAQDYVSPKIKELTEEEKKIKDKNYHIFRQEAFNLEPKKVDYEKRR